MQFNTLIKTNQETHIEYNVLLVSFDMYHESQELFINLLSSVLAAAKNIGFFFHSKIVCIVVFNNKFIIAALILYLMHVALFVFIQKLNKKFFSFSLMALKRCAITGRLIFIYCQRNFKC